MSKYYFVCSMSVQKKTYTRKHAHRCARIHTYTDACTHTCIYIYIYIYIYTHIYIYTQTHKQRHACTRTCTPNHTCARTLHTAHVHAHTRAQHIQSTHKHHARTRIARTWQMQRARTRTHCTHECMQHIHVCLACWHDKVKPQAAEHKGLRAVSTKGEGEASSVSSQHNGTEAS